MRWNLVLDRYQEEVLMEDNEGKGHFFDEIGGI